MLWNVGAIDIKIIMQMGRNKKVHLATTYWLQKGFTIASPHSNTQ